MAIIKPSNFNQDSIVKQYSTGALFVTGRWFLTNAWRAKIEATK
jgi:hypothetical protein